MQDEQTKTLILSGLGVEPHEIIDERRLAAVLSVSQTTLRNWRAQKRGPAYVKIGSRVGYLGTDIAQFVLVSRVAPDGGSRAKS